MRIFNAPSPDCEFYEKALPYPHLVIDGFLPLKLAEEARDTFPAPFHPIWNTVGRNYKKPDVADKFELTDYAAMPEPLQKVVDIINGPEFVAYLNELTGFDDLMADPTLSGGGLNMVRTGGFLRVHSDFNWSNELNAYRTVNVLYYLNPNWKEEDGGCLELWEQDMSRCAKIITPEFNRLIIFTTTNTSYHGYREVKNRPRNSFNFYFFRKEAAPGILSDPHKTDWRFEEGT